MHLMENDVIFAYLNELDPYHGVSEKIFQRLAQGELELRISSVTLVEMELIYRSQHVEDRLLLHLSAIAALPNVQYLPLNPETVITSVYLRQNHGLSFFDSHYAAAALNANIPILSFDQAYDRVPGLRRIKPENINAIK